MRDPDRNNSTSYTVPCCYEAGDWAPVEGCVELQDGMDEEGNPVYINRQKQKQTTAGPCAEGTGERYVPCCGYTEWTPVGQCEDVQLQLGIPSTTVKRQRIEREIGIFEGCGEEEEPLTESVAPCCGYTGWEPQACIRATEEGVEPSQQMIRSVIEPSGEPLCFPEEETQNLQGAVDCCFEDEWAPVDYCTLDETSGEYKQKYERQVYGAACNDTNNPTTKYETCVNELSCPGAWLEYPDPEGFPDCPEEGVCTNEIIYTRTWVKEQAPAGVVYTECPLDETKTCPAVPCDCEQGWDTSECPTEPGFVGNDPTKLKTWRVTTPATGTVTCISDYEDGVTAPCDATALKQVECKGSWGAWDTACPTTETDCGYQGGQITRTKTWTTETAPPGETYINCPPESESETLTCPATGACEIPCQGSWDTYQDGFPDCPPTDQCGYAGETFTRNWTTNPATAPPGQTYVGCPPETQSKTCPAVQPCPSDDNGGGTLIDDVLFGTAGAVLAYCTLNPSSCVSGNISPDADVDCKGGFDKIVPACKKTCGEEEITHKAT